MSGAAVGALCLSAVLATVLVAACGDGPEPPLSMPSAAPHDTAPALVEVEATPTAAGPVPTVRAAGTGGLKVVPDSLAWSGGGDVLAFASRDGAFYLTDGGSEQSVEGVAFGAEGRPFIRWSPDGSALLVGGAWFNGTTVFTGLWHVSVSSGRPGASVVIVPPSQVISTVGGNTGAVHGADWAHSGDRFAYVYRAEAWVATPAGQPVRLTHLTEKPLERGGTSPAFDGVRAVAFNAQDTALAMELSCACGAPWSGLALLELGEDDTPALVRDGMTLTGWAPDARLVGQNSFADWTPQSTVDGYAVATDSGAPENLTGTNPGVDPLADEAGTAQGAPMQSGPVEWDTGGSSGRSSLAYLYPLFVYSDGAAPHRGFAVRSEPGAEATMRVGSAEGWFVAPRWLDDGRISYIEADPGPAALVVLRRAVVGETTALPLDVMASGASFSPTGERLAIVEASIGATDDRVRIINLPE